MFQFPGFISEDSPFGIFAPFWSSLAFPPMSPIPSSHENEEPTQQVSESNADTPRVIPSNQMLNNPTPQQGVKRKAKAPPRPTPTSKRRKPGT